MKQKREVYESNIGPLGIFSLVVGDIRKLFSEMDDLKSVEPAVFIQHLIRYICFPEGQYGSDEIKPGNPILSMDDVKNLSAEDLSEIAKIHLNDEQFLYRKSIDKTETKDGKTIHSSVLGEIEYPKRPNEDEVTYLYRLYIIQAERWQEIHNKMMFPFREALFSDKVIDSIGKTIGLASDLKGTIESAKYYNSLTNSGSIMNSLNPNMQKQFQEATIQLKNANDSKRFDASEFIRQEAETKWAPFKMLGGKLDSIASVLNGSTDYLLQLNDTQLGIATETKQSNVENTKLSKRNIRLTVLVLLLTSIGILSGLASLYLTWSSMHQSNQTSRTYQEYLNELNGQLSKITVALKDNTRQADVGIRQITQVHREVQKSHNDLLQKQMNYLESIHQENAKNHQQSSDIIQHLNGRVAELENSLNKYVEIERNYRDSLRSIQELRHEIEELKTSNSSSHKNHDVD